VKAVTGTVAGVVVLAVLMTTIVRLQMVRERRFPQSEPAQQILYVNSPAVVTRLALSYDALLSDLYWIRAIQYYGGAKRRLVAQPATPEPPPMLAAVDTKEYNQLYALLDITTSLDPLFTIAYRFGAVFLAEAYPAGAGRVDLAVKLLEKGIAARPDKWEYMEDTGFVYYWYANDYHQAAAWFQKASEVAGAPVWLKGLAATTLAQGGDRQSSRTMWTAILETSEVEWMRTTAERVLLQLNALDQIDTLQAKVDAFAQQRGAPPEDWATVVRARVFPGVPVDPSGTRYELTREGRVRLSQSSRLFPLPVEPKRLGSQ